MSDIQTVKALIELWPSRKALAVDLGTSLDRVHKWAKADAIPAWFYARLLRAAAARGFVLSADDLVRLHDKQRAA